MLVVVVGTVVVLGNAVVMYPEDTSPGTINVAGVPSSSSDVVVDAVVSVLLVVPVVVVVPVLDVVVADVTV